MDPKFVEEFNGIKSELQEWKQAQYQSQVEADTQKLVALEGEMSKKYPKADLEVVYARVEGLINSGKIEGPITKEVWDKIYKDVHDKFDKLTKVEQKGKFDLIKNANLKGSSVGRGGSPPGQAPKKARSISEATDMLLEDLGKN
jgi:hypothetical protein